MTKKQQTEEANPPRILPPLDDENRVFWTAGVDGRLMILRCQTCDIWVHPPGPSCPEGHATLAPTEVSGRGRVWTYTVNRHVFHPSVPVPYVVAIVELIEQPALRIVANVVGCRPEEVSIDMDVRVEFEKQGEYFVPYFVPLSDQPEPS